MKPSEQIERELAEKYKQPKNVEQFGVERIPDELRTVRWWDIFAIFLNFLINPGTITISGILIAAGLGFWQAMVTGVLSILIGFSVYLIAATVGSDYAIPGLVSMRAIFGIRGAAITSILRALSSIYWFAFQTVAASLGIAMVLHRLFDRDFSLIWISVGCAVLQLVVSMYGYHALAKLSRFAFVYKLIFSCVIIVMLMTFPEDGYAPSEVLRFAGSDHGQITLMAFWAFAWGTSWFTNFTDAADFCRYTKSRKEMWLGTLLAAIVGQLICSFIGGYAVAALGGDMGPEDSALTVIVDTTRGSWILLVLLLVYVVLDAWMINVQNLYTAGLAITSLFSRVGRFWGTLGVGILGIALSMSSTLISGFDGYMDALGNIFAPLAGVFVAHYVILQRWGMQVDELFTHRDSRYWYWGGVNWVAMIAVAVGIPVNHLVPQEYGNILVSAAFSGLVYLVLVRLSKSGSDQLTNALYPIPHRPTFSYMKGDASVDAVRSDYVAAD
ncbi:cytosine permease [Gordonia spumicola]|uniref:Cytosine permease n=1 Tax=Gordonia spumicola TaxID=589161 RepID=A0A7I9V346_9ACTN|nr:cytosine permease [Gordonia spumicola]GED99827.1 cytosine permease [Gordonia spumicola]